MVPDDNIEFSENQQDLFGQLMRALRGEQRFVLDKTKVPGPPIVNIHVDDAKATDIEQLVYHLITDHGKVVYRCPHPWGEKGTLKFTEEPPAVGEVMMPELLAGKLKLDGHRNDENDIELELVEKGATILKHENHDTQDLKCGCVVYREKNKHMGWLYAHRCKKHQTSPYIQHESGIGYEVPERDFVGHDLYYGRLSCGCEFRRMFVNDIPGHDGWILHAGCADHGTVFWFGKFRPIDRSRPWSHGFDIPKDQFVIGPRRVQPKDRKEVLRRLTCGCVVHRWIEDGIWAEFGYTVVKQCRYHQKHSFPDKFSEKPGGLHFPEEMFLETPLTMEDIKELDQGLGDCGIQVEENEGNEEIIEFDPQNNASESGRPPDEDKK